MSGNTDEQQIREVISRWLRATSDGKVEDVLNLMTTDVVFLVAGQYPMRGRDAFASGMRQALQHVRIDGDTEIKEIRVDNNHAHCWSQVNLTLTPVNGGATKRRAGPVLSVFRRDTDGQWRLHRDANMLTDVS